MISFGTPYCASIRCSTSPPRARIAGPAARDPRRSWRRVRPTRRWARRPAPASTGARGLRSARFPRCARSRRGSADGRSARSAAPASARRPRTARARAAGRARAPGRRRGRARAPAAARGAGFGGTWPSIGTRPSAAGAAATACDAAASSGGGDVRVGLRVARGWRGLRARFTRSRGFQEAERPLRARRHLPQQAFERAAAGPRRAPRVRPAPARRRGSAAPRRAAAPAPP